MCNAVVFICVNEDNAKVSRVKEVSQDIFALHHGFPIREHICGNTEDGEWLIEQLLALLDQEEMKYILCDHPDSFANALGCEPVDARRFAYNLSLRGLNVLFDEDPFFNCREPRRMTEDEDDDLKLYVEGMKEIRRWEPDRENWTPDREKQRRS